MQSSNDMPFFCGVVFCGSTWNVGVFRQVGTSISFSINVGWLVQLAVLMVKVWIRTVFTITYATRAWRFITRFLCKTIGCKPWALLLKCKKTLLMGGMIVWQTEMHGNVSNASSEYPVLISHYLACRQRCRRFRISRHGLSQWSPMFIPGSDLSNVFVDLWRPRDHVGAQIGHY